MKEYVDADIAKLLVKQQFPKWSVLPIKPVETSGWDNRTFHLGDDKLLRFPSAAGYAIQVEREQRWLPVLAPKLPLEIPVPIGLGQPGFSYPWKWSVYKWIPGDTVAIRTDVQKTKIATSLSGFLSSLYNIETTNGPRSDEQNYYRGAPVNHYHEEAIEAIKRLEKNSRDSDILREIWLSGSETTWGKPPVWVHGDVAPGNLIIQDDELTAVIDFGLLSVGDPACDLAISWTYFNDESRDVFKNKMSLDNATWRRGRSWALWKALILKSGMTSSNPIELSLAEHVIREAVSDYITNG